MKFQSIENKEKRLKSSRQKNKKQNKPAKPGHMYKNVGISDVVDFSSATLEANGKVPLKLWKKMTSKLEFYTQPNYQSSGRE